MNSLRIPGGLVKTNSLGKKVGAKESFTSGEKKKKKRENDAVFFSDVIYGRETAKYNLIKGFI